MLTARPVAQTVDETKRIENTLTVDEAVALGSPVALSTTVANRVVRGRADTDTKARVIAVARTAAAAPGDTIEAVSTGPALGILVGATVGTAYYLAASGGLSTTVPPSGNRIVQVGIAINATDLFVRVVDYGKRA